MPRFLRVGNDMIHIPSLSSVTIGTTCFGKPYIALSYHATKKILCVSYKNWELCQIDFNRVKLAMGEVEELMGKILLTEPDIPHAQKEIEKTIIKLNDEIVNIDLSTHDMKKGIDGSSPKQAE